MMRILLILLTLSLSTVAAALDQSDLLPVDEAFRIEASAPAADRIEVRFTIAEGYYLYRHRLGLSRLDGQALPPFSVPDGEHKVDEFFGEVESYRHSLLMTQSLPASDSGSLQLEVRYQGCADLGICYPPQKRTVSVTLPAAAPMAPGLNLGSGSGGLNLSGAEPAIAGSAQDALPEDQAFKFAALAAGSDRLLIRFEVAPGYYLYRDKTVLRLEAEGARLGTPQWPPAQDHEDAHFGKVAVYFQSPEVNVPVVRTQEGAQRVTVHAEFQGCKDLGICYPVMRRAVELELPAGPGTPAATADAASATPATPAAGLDAGLNLFQALIFALLGGLVLNLMPCVLPILSLKAIGLAKSGHGSGYARSHALWYTLGVLSSFAALGMAILALRAGGEALGWGFQLQQPLFVAVLVYLMTALGLSMSGAVTIGASWGGLGHSLTEDEGRRGAFFTGVLACVVASPCTTPFMGGALAFAIAQPAWAALAVFLALGLGLALPFLLIGFIPALANRLPRPGAWMETLKQFLAFPMYLTGVWLVWVLGHQVGMDGAGAALVGSVMLALALWWWEREQGKTGWGWRALLLAFFALAVLPLAYISRLDPATGGSPSAQANGYEAYSPERLAELQGEGRLVFVNMTADWCVTCKVNERTVLSRDAFKQTLARHNGVYLKGDWTNEDPRITEFLQRFRAVGVPLYVIFPPRGEPVILPSILTQSMVQEALDQAMAK